MKVEVYRVDAHDPDCLRYDFCTRIAGKEVVLIGSALDTEFTYRDLKVAVGKRFGPDAEIEWSCE